jgi:hypothetical protein
MASCGGEGPAQIVVRNVTGHVIASAGAGYAFAMPWGGLNGTYPLLHVAVDFTTLCTETAANWAGKVILANSFYGFATSASDSVPIGCSYETRARVAFAQGAAGMLLSGGEHSPFDWDGTSQRDLIPATVLTPDGPGGAYECIDNAVVAAGGEATIELQSERTPLLEPWFGAICWVLFTPIVLLAVTNLCVSIWQQWRFSMVPTDASTRVVVGLETLFSVFVILRILNGPGCAAAALYIHSKTSAIQRIPNFPLPTLSQHIVPCCATGTTSTGKRLSRMAGIGSPSLSSRSST